MALCLFSVIFIVLLACLHHSDSVILFEIDPTLGTKEYCVSFQNLSVNVPFDLEFFEGIEFKHIAGINSNVAFKFLGVANPNCAPEIVKMYLTNTRTYLSLNSRNTSTCTPELLREMTSRFRLCYTFQNKTEDYTLIQKSSLKTMEFTMHTRLFDRTIVWETKDYIGMTLQNDSCDIIQTPRWTQYPTPITSTLGAQEGKVAALSITEHNLGTQGEARLPGQCNETHWYWKCSLDVACGRTFYNIADATNLGDTPIFSRPQPEESLPTSCLFISGGGTFLAKPCNTTNPYCIHKLLFKNPSNGHYASDYLQFVIVPPATPTAPNISIKPTPPNATTNITSEPKPSSRLPPGRPPLQGTIKVVSDANNGARPITAGVATIAAISTPRSSGSGVSSKILASSLIQSMVQCREGPDDEMDLVEHITQIRIGTTLNIFVGATVSNLVLSAGCFGMFYIYIIHFRQETSEKLPTYGLTVFTVLLQSITMSSMRIMMHGEGNVLVHIIGIIGLIPVVLLLFTIWKHHAGDEKTLARYNLIFEPYRVSKKYWFGVVEYVFLVSFSCVAAYMVQRPEECVPQLLIMCALVVGHLVLILVTQPYASNKLDIATNVVMDGLNAIACILLVFELKEEAVSVLGIIAIVGTLAGMLWVMMEVIKCWKRKYGDLGGSGEENATSPRCNSDDDHNGDSRHVEGFSIALTETMLPTDIPPPDFEMSFSSATSPKKGKNSMVGKKPPAHVDL
eukprot:PhF_6_TR2259/c0_g1_i1/m.3871